MVEEVIAIRPFVAVAAMLLLLTFPETALNAALSAAHTWYYSVAPALFPFMALMPMLTCAESVRVWERLFGRFMRPLLNLPGAAAPALVIAMTAGSPAGAHAAVRICASAGMTSGQLERILICACGFSPAFLVSGIGAAMLGSPAGGRLLLRAQLFSQCAMLLLTRNAPPGAPLPPAEEQEKPEPVRAAVNNVLAVCGYMALFAAAAAVAARILKRRNAGLAVLCLLDVPSAARALTELSVHNETKLLLLAALTGWGGGCIAAQNLAACKNMGVRVGKYVSSRLAHALLSAAAAAVALHLFPSNGGFFRFPLEISALTAVFLLVPVLIFWKKDPFLNKRNFGKTGRNEAENA